MQSFDRAAGQYGTRVDQSRSERLHLEDINYDLGQSTKRGGYKLEDQAYAFWLDKLAEKNFSTATPQIRAALARYYQDPKAATETKKHPEDGSRVLAQLAALKAAGPLRWQRHLAAAEVWVDWANAIRQTKWHYVLSTAVIMGGNPRRIFNEAIPAKSQPH